MIPSNLRDIFQRNIISFSQTDLILFLDEINFPSVLINVYSKDIICGNGCFINLTGIGNNELNHMKIDQLLIADNIDLSIENSPCHGQLITKNKSKIPVSFIIKNISKESKVSILKIIPSKQSFSSNIDSSVFYEKLKNIFIISISGDDRQVIESVLNLSNYIFGGYPKTIYKKFGEVLSRQNSEKIFPEELLPIELERISDLDIWYPGKRILCEAHRIGRQNGLPGLISAPIVNDHFQGLLVSGIASQDFFLTNQSLIESFIDWINQLIYLAYEISKMHLENASSLSQLQNLQIFVEKANDMLLILSNENRIEFASKKFLDKMHYSAYEVLGKSISDIVNNEIIQKTLSKAKEGLGAVNQEIVLHNRNGKQFFMELQFEIIPTDSGITKIISLTDRTHISELERSIDRIQKQASLGESIADFAHDARNPLNNISTGLQMLRKLYVQNISLVDAIDRMQADCIRMSDLIESVLSYSRQNVEDFTRIDLDALLSSIYKRFEKKFRKNNIKTSYKNDLESTIIKGDFRSLERVFINLINNSIESMEGMDGELAVLIRSGPGNNNQIEISIADTGPGIPKDMLEKIFEPYISGKKTGTGLGLAITKKIIDAHGGKIEIESFTSGTIFRIFLNQEMEAL